MKIDVVAAWMCKKRANLVQASLRSDGLEVAVLCATQIPHHRFDPHCLKVPLFAEPGNGKGVWQFLSLTCSAEIGFAEEETMHLAQEGQLPAGEVLSTQSTAGTQTGCGGSSPIRS